MRPRLPSDIFKVLSLRLRLSFLPLLYQIRTGNSIIFAISMMASTYNLRDAEAIEEDEQQYGSAELDDKFPDRPRNSHRSLPFHELYVSLFNPLNDNKKHTSGPNVSRAKQGPHGPSKLSPHEQRRNIIDRFISRWRNEVGDDFYPALRLIIPEKDRDRAMYGLKEKAIGKLVVKLLKINPSSEDGYNLTNWKNPGQTTASRMAGDFAGRCYEVLAKRAMRQEPGDMRIGEVNILLDKLSATQKEEKQLELFEIFYNRMNADELMWLIRVILRQMKLGASEKTILDLWHPDGEALFNVSSSLRRVCWELTDPTKQFADDGTPSVELMQCFQPQLAQFQTHSFQKMIEKLGWTEENPEFWIEEKLDGERMQMHMQEDDSHPGGRRFAFWSRKAKDYTYLYGNGFEDDHSALTRHIREAFSPQVKNIILDGEMITWDPTTNKMVAFGTLKTAALSEQRNPFAATGIRPLFRVFDCLYLNDQVLTQYTLKDRRDALVQAVNNVKQRIEVHEYQLAKTADEIDPALRKVVADASEGLVLKNPQSMYRLNSRNDDWMKVKPEYMTEFGESLDCIVIGGYYGSGRRGGGLSSFLCGLRVSENYRVKHEGTNPMKCVSFFKVGGGFRAEDYANVRHKTDGKWIEWDRDHPPDDYIILGGDGKQYERPDMWIKPNDSIVVEAKAASVGASDQFGTKFTLRFPRFKRVRDDKSWETALSVDEFMVLKKQAEEESSKNKEFKVDTKRKMSKRLKKAIMIAGNDGKFKAQYAGPKTAIFEGLSFCVLTEMLTPEKKPKSEVEQLLKANGGSIFQSPAAKENIICIGDKKVVKVASLIKSSQTNIVKPSWVVDALKQAEADGPGRQKFLLPFEPSHMFHMTNEAKPGIEDNVDPYGDSYTRNVNSEDLRITFREMIHPKHSSFSPQTFISELEQRGRGLGELRASIFKGCLVQFPTAEAELLSLPRKLEINTCKYHYLFGGGKIAESDESEGLTHLVIVEEDLAVVRRLRANIAKLRRSRFPRIVSLRWLQESWSEGTLLDEERYAMPG